jgi:hypothetical protein
MVRLLLTLTWFLSGGALLAGLAALVKARRTAKRLERLTESYWELRYEHGQLRARFNQISPDPSAAGVGADEAPQGGANAFIPLSSLKR